MTKKVFSIDDLKRILLDGAGEPEGPGVEAATVDLGFQELGYDSLAVLETCTRIEREFGVSLDEEVLGDAGTPRALVDIVNNHLSVAHLA
ncbi:actinorhodin polyketide synthase [Streptomyces sp. V2]|uniref:Acyl carrier protein n=1 Tax=Streptomyces niveiscabiei TaxID=164115 RepID=A0ABW9HGZ3_9ACTN|nr:MULTISPECIES: acyl carrier protein [Streptomyces]PWG11809.1 actinorhodin polyketide synthase [Streptomyces sp. V2]QZZ25114.1 acyl carrier protein [Streptomyces sp. ST1015]